MLTFFVGQSSFLEEVLLKFTPLALKRPLDTDLARFLLIFDFFCSSLMPSRNPEYDPTVSRNRDLLLPVVSPKLLVAVTLLVLFLNRLFLAVLHFIGNFLFFPIMLPRKFLSVCLSNGMFSLVFRFQTRSAPGKIFLFSLNFGQEKAKKNYKKNTVFINLFFVLSNNFSFDRHLLFFYPFLLNAIIDRPSNIPKKILTTKKKNSYCFKFLSCDRT